MTATDAWTVVAAFGSAVNRGDHTLGIVPELLKRVLREESWRDFTTPRGEVVHHERFVDFLTTPPTHGVGASVELVRRIVGDDVEAVDLLDRALQRPVGANQHGGDKTNGPIHLAGNGQQKALRRLRKDRPDLHADVLAGNLSAHAAMVAAGYRPRTATVRVGDPVALVATLARAHTDLAAVRAEIDRLLAGDAR